jgi:hypothetical protein
MTTAAASTMTSSMATVASTAPATAEIKRIWSDIGYYLVIK